MTAAVTLAAMGNGPAFSAYKSGAQSITSGSYIRVVLNLEQFDTNSCFDSTTNSRFTPTVAGYYQFSAQVNISAASGLTYFYTDMYKNSVSVNSIFSSSLAGVVGNQNASALIYMNGSTDYLELYVNSAAGTTITCNVGSVLQGFLARGA